MHINMNMCRRVGRNRAFTTIDYFWSENIGKKRLLLLLLAMSYPCPTYQSDEKLVL